jgi:heme-degrading monooxygenase HmoA
MATTIDANNGVVTLVNIFQVAPEDQQRALDILFKATEYIETLPGFVSASFHRTADGTRIINYAQWKDEASWRAMLGDEEARGHIAGLMDFTTFEANLYEIVGQFGGTGID